MKLSFVPLSLGVLCIFFLGLSACAPSTPSDTLLPQKPEAVLSLEKEVQAAVDHYFAVWSKNDMAAYRACFHEQAVIHFVQLGGGIQAVPLDPFIQSQVHSHQDSPGMTEHAVKTEILLSEDGKGAQATVRWKLLKGLETTLGYDFFTFIKTPDGWKIVSLVFYADLKS